MRHFIKSKIFTLRKSKSASLKRGKTIGPSWNSYSLVRPPHRVTVDLLTKFVQILAVNTLLHSKQEARPKKNQCMVD